MTLPAEEGLPALASILRQPNRSERRSSEFEKPTSPIPPAASVIPTQTLGIQPNVKHRSELGSGTGCHSKVLVETGANVICTDISPASLAVLSKVFAAQGLAVKTFVTSMESTPFEDASFDVIVSAGSLSYADPNKLDDEIIRLLKPNGSFICVDSFDHNLIYRFNRWIHWRVIGDRTASTFQRIPTLLRMQNLGLHFGLVSIEGFGAWAWIYYTLTFLFGQRFAALLTRAFDNLPKSQRLAFKIVFVAQKLRCGRI